MTINYGSIVCCKVKHIKTNYDDLCLELSAFILESLNADFDGDTVSVILVPEEAAEDTYKKMSPRYNKIYKKNLKSIHQ